MEKKNFIEKPKRSEIRTLRTMIVLGVICLLNFAYWFFDTKWIDNKLLFALLSLTLVYSGLRILYEWYHYWSISVPVPPATQRKFSVDVLTTYFPGEPYAMIEETLLAIKNIRYPHTTILCDEGNDPHLITFCKLHGIVHVTRDNRIDAKAGNINNALRTVATGEICVILDPDHVPQPDFLDPIIPYFEDEQIGFVQIVQAYKNLDESYVAKGAAQQTFQFYGPMMMCMNSYGTVNAIGANCTFRRAALDSIGGHAPGLAEDMHTAMQLHAKGWKSVYLPMVLARGLVPSSLTAYYKQQLKWSRGTLELLFAVYPKLFRKFNWRQRIHYGTLPLHYLIGLFYLINFSIPVISLVTATTPWKGNLLFFSYIALPLMASVILIRTFVQRWVMEESERGFHIVGGLLQITSWWIFTIGTLYTLFRKKVPYLPTPKTGEDQTSWQLLLPNALVAFISIAAVIYGLYIDFTPFSLFMSGFALLNAFFMGLTVYFGLHRYQKLDELKGAVERKYYFTLRWIKVLLWDFRHEVYRRGRIIAFPLLIICIGFSGFLVYYNSYMKWEGVGSYEPLPRLNVRSLGVYFPGKNEGNSDISMVHNMEEDLKFKFDILSHYVAWGDLDNLDDLQQVLNTSRQGNYIPLITWEPWQNNFSFTPGNKDFRENKRIFKWILEGKYDDYLQKVSQLLKASNQTVYLRFAHEFDNPDYPWSPSGENSPETFREAWKYVHDFLTKQGNSRILWVWNPWKSKAIAPYYPGDDYVDFVGLTGLNYGDLINPAETYSFEELYLPFRREMLDLNISKPVIIAEFGSLKFRGNQDQWISEGLKSIYLKFPEITTVVFFNSNTDKNVPDIPYALNKLDWSIERPSAVKETLWHLKDSINASSTLGLDSVLNDTPIRISNFAITKNLIGVNYNKGQNWYKNYQVLTRESIVRDFDKLSQLGITHLKFYGSEIYHYNIFRLSELYGLKISYGLWQDETAIPAMKGSEAEKLKREILQKVRKLKDQPSIESWHIGNDLLSHLWKYEKSGMLYEMQQEYLKWLQQLVQEIKSEDPKRPVIVELELNQRSVYHTQLLNKWVSGIDAIGLSVKELNHFRKFNAYARDHQLAYLISDLSNESLRYFDNKDYLPTGFYFQNWQDRHESNLLSFDGLLDFQGLPKTEYAEAVHFLFPGYEIPETVHFRILRPAKLLFPGKTYRYYAVYLNPKSNRYQYPNDSDPKQFTWQMIKYDHFGNPIAMKELGNQPYIDVTIPEDADNFKLAIRYRSDGYSKFTVSSLNTPLIAPHEGN